MPNRNSKAGTNADSDIQPIAYSSASIEANPVLYAVIPQSKEELLDCIHNLMAVIDTPVGRMRFKGEFVNEVRLQARKIMGSNGRSLYGI
jgi:hypothetical protein